MTRVDRYHACIQEALEILETLPAGRIQDSKRALIAAALVHSDEDEARRQLFLIQHRWQRYQVSIELFAAYARTVDEQRIKALIAEIRCSEESDGSDEQTQLKEIKRMHADGWRSNPERVVLDRDHVAMCLERSDERVRLLLQRVGPSFILLSEYCLRIMYGDVGSLSEASKIAGDNPVDRDHVALAIGKSYAIMGKIATAKKHVEKLLFPENRIELLVNIFCAERELLMQGGDEFMH